MAAGSTYSCGRASMLMHSDNDRYTAQQGTYGRTFVIDLARQRAIPIHSAADCRALRHAVQAIQPTAA